MRDEKAICVRMTLNEYKKIKELATDAGLSVSAYLRTKALKKE